MQRLMKSEKMAKLGLVIMKITTILLLCLCTGVDNEYGEPDNDAAYFRPWIRKQHLARFQDLQSDKHYIDPSSSIHSYDNHHGSIRFKRGASAPLENGAQQLESLVILTNSLILSEAVRTKKTSIGKIAVDLLLMEQMPSDDVEWIEIVTSQQMDAGKSNEMKQKLEKTEKLKNMIDKGEAKQVNVDLMSKLNVDVFQTFSTNADLLLKIGKEHNGTNYDIVTYKGAMKFMTLLPHAAKALKNLKDEKTLDSLKEGFKFIKKTKEIDALKLLKESQIACESYKTGKNGHDSDQQLKKCLINLQEVAKSLTSPLSNLKEATMVFHFFLTSTFSTKLRKQGFETIVTEFKALMSATKHYFEKIVKPKSEIPQPNNYYRQILKDFEAVKTSKELPALKESLDLFIPLAEIADEIMVLYKHRNSKTPSSNEFLNGFKSYKCLPNGAKSINTLMSTAGSSASISSEFFLSGIVKRTSVIQNWITAINPIIQHSAGLGAIKETSKGIVQIMGNSRSMPGGLENQFVDVDSLVRKIAEDTTEIIEQLDIVVRNTKSLKKIPEWEKGIENLPDIMSDDTITAMSDLFSILPPYVDFVLTLNQTSKIQTLDIKSSEQKIIESLFENMNGVFDNLPSAVHVLETIDTITTDHPSALKEGNIDEQIEKIKSSFSEAKNLNIAKLTSDVEVDMDRFAVIIEKAATIDSELGNMHKNKSKFESFSKSISNVFPPSISRKKRDQNSVSNQDVDAAKQLMTGLGKIQKVDTNMDESSQIGQLMEGEPFGNDILDDMYKGMDDYRKISQQVGSTKNIQNAIADLKIEDSKLATEVGTLLTGNEVLEIVPVQDKINVFEIMENIPKIDTNLEKLQKWVETRNEDDRKRVETELNGLKVSAGLMRRKQISMLHFVVSKINKPFATNIEKLRKGLKKFQEKLKSVDCRQNAAHPSCQSTESDNLTNLIVGGIGILFALLLIVGLVVLLVMLIRYMRMKKDYEVNGYHMFCENYKVQYSLLKKTPYVKGSLAFQARREHKRAGVCENRKTAELDPKYIRYPDMPLKDEYRVKLPKEPPGKYLIHATRINMLRDRVWIAVQAPLPSDLCNDLFYQAMIEENVTLIVQLCGDSEKTIPVTYRKGPTDNYSVKIEEVKGGKHNKEAMEHTKLSILTYEPTELNVIDHLHFKLWPDHDVPTDDDAVIALMEKVLEIEKSHESRLGNIAVHCMAGAGRTVSFMAFVYMAELLRGGQRADFHNVVQTMRERRHKGVQNEMQYAWLFVIMAKFCAENANDADKPEQIENYKRIRQIFDAEKSKFDRTDDSGRKKPWWKFWKTKEPKKNT